MITVAVLGLGRLGIAHVENLLKILTFEVLAVCDSKLEVAQQVARTYHIPFSTADPEAIFADEAIQAVVIVTSTTTHFELVTKAIRAGKFVFVEKPLTINLQQSLAIEQLITETNGYCQVGFMRRFDPDYMAAKRAIAEGHIGEPIYFKAISRDPYAPPLSFIERSGGIFIDLMIHDIDLAHYLLQQPIEQVAAFGSNIKYPELKQAEDVDQALMYVSFANGAAGDLEGSRCAYYGYDVRTEIIGTEGTLLIGSNKRTNVQLLTKQQNTYEVIPVFQERFESAYLQELSAFAQAIEQQSPSLATVKDSIQALKVAHAATTSYREQGALTVTNV